MNDSAVTPIRVFVRLSGPRRGQSQLLSGNVLEVAMGADGTLEIDPQTASEPLFHLNRSATGYDLSAAAETPLWVNGKPVQTRVLKSGDVVEVGDQRHVIRYREYGPGTKGYKSMREAFSDCLECARHSNGFLDRMGILVLGTLYEMATQIRPAYRILLLAGFTAAVFALACCGFRTSSCSIRSVSNW